MPYAAFSCIFVQTKNVETMLNKLFKKPKNVRKFTTNINCGKCMMAVTPYMEQVEGLQSWDVDLKSSERTLTIRGNAEKAHLAEALSKAGYTLGEEVQ